MVQMDGGTESGYFVYIGNPNLEPMITNTYEMGFQYSMASRLKLDLATYYKDISNWVSSQEVTNIPFVDDGTGYGNPGVGQHQTLTRLHTLFTKQVTTLEV